MENLDPKQVYAYSVSKNEGLGFTTRPLPPEGPLGGSGVLKGRITNFSNPLGLRV